MGALLLLSGRQNACNFREHTIEMLFIAENILDIISVVGSVPVRFAQP